VYSRFWFKVKKNILSGHKKYDLVLLKPKKELSHKNPNAQVPEYIIQALNTFALLLFKAFSRAFSQNTIAKSYGQERISIKFENSKYYVNIYWYAYVTWPRSA
jgi:hypothetical protein